MLGRCRRVVSFTAVIVCALGPVAARPPAKLQDDAPVSRVVDGPTIDSTIREYLDTVPVPGVAVAVTRGDRVLVAQGYGHTPGGDPIGQHTPMAVASVSKSFTALAVIQLVEAGLVDLDRPVRVYLPEFTMADSRVDQVTVRQLLNQTSGLSDRTFPAFSRRQPHSLHELVAGIRTVPLAAIPGSRWEYHNPNYQIAARMVEVVSGMAFDAYLRQHVFGPLGMRDSRTINTADDLPPSARGHMVVLGVPLAVPEPRAFGNGSGGVLSSAHDMAAWLIMQGQRGRGPDGAAIVSPASIATMRTPSPASGTYALGWIIGETASGSPMLSHSGDLFTSTGQQLLLTDTGWGVAVMANTGLVHGHARDIAALIVALIEGRPVPSVSIWPQVLIDVVMLAFTAVIIAQAVRGVRRSHIWGTRRARLWIQLARILPLLAPLLACGTIHRLVGFLYRGRDVAWVQVLYLYPTFMVLLVAASLAGVAVFCARLARLATARAADCP
jgi:CubicO group peptidase (beta-lactamase class C family)